MASGGEDPFGHLWLSLCIYYFGCQPKIIFGVHLVEHTMQFWLSTSERASERTVARQSPSLRAARAGERQARATANHHLKGGDRLYLVQVASAQNMFELECCRRSIVRPSARVITTPSEGIALQQFLPPQSGWRRAASAGAPWRGLQEVHEVAQPGAENLAGLLLGQNGAVRQTASG